MNKQNLDRRFFLGLSGTAAIGGLLVLAAGGASSSASVVSFEFRRSDSEWRRRLGPQRYAILRKEGTERAFTSPLLKEHRKGAFDCAGCGLPLFSSTAKYDSGTGWPSFWKALPGAIATSRDMMFGMVRVEEHCRRCGGHLGHIFDDGPPPTGQRHCINGLSLIFKPA